MRRRSLVVLGCILACGGCAGEDTRTEHAANDPRVVAAQQERVERLRRRQGERGSALKVVAGQRERATRELLRIRRTRGRDTATRFELRYGSDGTGDPRGWRQSGAQATRAPTSTADMVARFEQARAGGRITLAGAAQAEEVRRGLIDDRVLGVLVALSQRHRIEVNSLRVSHPRTVQDELGTPTASNHVFGRAADISAVDGVACRRETSGAAYRTLTDNPPPARHGPCLALAHEAAALGQAPGEIIFYWRVPGPTGVSLPNHDDHVHVGFRSYPSAGEGPLPMWESETLEVPPSGDGDGTSAD